MIELDVKPASATLRTAHPASCEQGRRKFPTLALAFACALFLISVARPALCFSLGEAEVYSALTQPLLVKIPYQSANDGDLIASCVRVFPGSDASSHLPSIMNIHHSLQSSAGKHYIVLESRDPVNEPAVGLAVEVKCGTIAMSREFVLVLDLPKNFAAVKPEVERASENMQRGAEPPGSATFAYPETRAKRPASREQPEQVTRSKQRAEVRKSPQAPNKERPVPRIAPDEVNASPDDGRPCCFRLSYEMTDSDRVQISEGERQQLRQEMQDRMSDDEPAIRLRMMRDELGRMRKQLTESASELATAQAIDQQRAKETRNVWGYILNAIYLIVAIAVVLALLQWLSAKRRQKSHLAGKAGDDGEPVVITPPELVSILTSQFSLPKLAPQPNTRF